MVESGVKHLKIKSQHGHEQMTGNPDNLGPPMSGQENLKCRTVNIINMRHSISCR